METIKFFGRNHPYRFLSNFYPCEIELFNMIFPSSEHLYQAYKARDPDRFISIMSKKKPIKAKKLANSMMPREDWEEIKYDVMKLCLWLKFSQNSDLGDRLLQTGDARLIEDSPTDRVWGGRDGGLNLLGKALMEVRDVLQSGDTIGIDPYTLLAFPAPEDW